MCDSCSCQPQESTPIEAVSGRDFVVAGMTCSSCAAKVGAAVRQVAGVTGVEVDAVTGRLTVAGDAADTAITAAVVGAGYQITR